MRFQLATAVATLMSGLIEWFTVNPMRETCEFDFACSFNLWYFFPLYHSSEQNSRINIAVYSANVWYLTVDDIIVIYFYFFDSSVACGFFVHVISGVTRWNELHTARFGRYYSNKVKRETSGLADHHFFVSLHFMRSIAFRTANAREPTSSIHDRF